MNIRVLLPESQDVYEDREYWSQGAAESTFSSEDERREGESQIDVSYENGREGMTLEVDEAEDIALVILAAVHYARSRTSGEDHE